MLSTVALSSQPSRCAWAQAAVGVGPPVATDDRPDSDERGTGGLLTWREQRGSVVHSLFSTPRSGSGSSSISALPQVPASPGPDTLFGHRHQQRHCLLCSVASACQTRRMAPVVCDTLLFWAASHDKKELHSIWSTARWLRGSGQPLSNSMTMKVPLPMQLI